IAECARILRPGGVLLATVPCTIRVDDEGGQDGDFWRLTEASARRLFAQAFPVDAFEVTAYGNVMACAAFLYGLSVEEMAAADLDHVDSNFPTVVAIRAVKPVEADSVAQSAGRPGARAAALKGPRYVGSRGAILCYHRVAELTPDSHALCTPPDEFRAHMACLARDFSPIGLEELVRAAAAGRIPERAVAVTLDDGYLDALAVASPILTGAGVPATFFINTDRLDKPHERWWDVLERVFLPDAALPARLALRVSGSELQLATATAAERKAALEALNRTAWPLDAHARAKMLEDVLAWSGTPHSPRQTHRMMTADELRELARRPGHTIGAHSVHHLSLTLQPAETKRREIVDNKIELERLLGRPVNLFSYPYGEFDAATVTVVGDAGFHAAVTVEAGLVSSGTNRLLLPRFEIGVRQRTDFPSHLRELFNACLLSR
ncbi:MAG: polysaccharide deacetylase family protein, partial [Acidobacteria bacterium]|nr:polysaccharide deacetylase family protein [Acidobacteriota bacterium]